MTTPLPSPFPTPYGHHDHDHDRVNRELEYTLRVRGTVYLWGSSGITDDVNFASPLFLHIRNDQFGEEITIATEKANGHHKDLGTLQPGEHFAIHIDEIRGIYATCATESTVGCAIGR